MLIVSGEDSSKLWIATIFLLQIFFWESVDSSPSFQSCEADEEHNAKCRQSIFRTKAEWLVRQMDENDFRKSYNYKGNWENISCNYKEIKSVAGDRNIYGTVIKFDLKTEFLRIPSPIEYIKVECLNEKAGGIFFVDYYFVLQKKKGKKPVECIDGFVQNRIKPKSGKFSIFLVELVNMTLSDFMEQVPRTSEYLRKQNNLIEFRDYETGSKSGTETPLTSLWNASKSRNFTNVFVGNAGNCDMLRDYNDMAPGLLDYDMWLLLLAWKNDYSEMTSGLKPSIHCVGGHRREYVALGFMRSLMPLYTANDFFSLLRVFNYSTALDNELLNSFKTLHVFGLLKTSFVILFTSSSNKKHPLFLLHPEEVDSTHLDTLINFDNLLSMILRILQIEKIRIFEE